MLRRQARTTVVLLEQALNQGTRTIETSALVSPDQKIPQGLLTRSFQARVLFGEPNESTTESFRLPVNGRLAGLSAKVARKGGKVPISEDAHRWLIRRFWVRLSPTRTPTNHFLWRRIPRTLSVNASQVSNGSSNSRSPRHAWGSPNKCCQKARWDKAWHRQVSQVFIGEAIAGLN